MRLPRGLDAGVTQAQPYVEAQACQAMGLNYWEWRTGGYPAWFMDEVVAWYAIRNAVEAHVNEASTRASKRKGRR